MLKQIKQVLKEQFEYFGLIIQMAAFENKSLYQSHYLGSLWQIINPAIQILIYWIVFGLGLRGVTNTDLEVPFILWLLMGLIPWFFIAPTIIQGSNSVYQRVSLVSRMKFPVSVLPTIKLVANSYQFIVMLMILITFLLIYGVNFDIKIIQLPYYLFCLYIFVFAFTLLSSTISVLLRDFQSLLQSTMRMLLYLSPILWNPAGDNVPDWLTNILKLNPFYYIIEGIRNSFLGGDWFFEDVTYLLYFWSLTLLILLIGAEIHIKFRRNFMDYL